MKRRHDAVKLNSALRNAAPSAKPSTISAAEAGWPSSQHQRDQHGRASTRGDQERPVEPRQLPRRGASTVVVS